MIDIVAGVFADFVEAPTGGPSQLGTELGGQPILVRTLRRLLNVEGVVGRCLMVRPRDRDAAAAMLNGAGLTDEIELVALDDAQRTRRVLLQTARKWHLDSWRGGLVGTSWFDEFVEPHAVARLLNHCKCGAILCLDGHQPVFDPALASAMCEHLQQNEHVAKSVFTQAPPGLAGIILCRTALEDLLELNIPLGLMLTYRPEMAQFDPIIQQACYHVPPVVGQTAARFTGDTRRGRELLAEALRELGADAPAEALCVWARQAGHDRAGELPIEVELELTTDDPLPETTLRPRGRRVPRRCLDDIECVSRLAEQLSEYDDRLVFLGGHGDPLEHPRFAEVCQLLRDGGLFGIGLATTLLELTDTAMAALFDNQIDVVEVLIDAHDAATYERLHGVDGLARVHANVERLENARRDRKAPRPIIACSLTRCAATIDELEAFHDDWIRNVGSSVIHGYNDYCGLLPADSLLPTVPSTRAACRRLATRMMLLADGAAVLCAQDYRGRVRLGDWRVDSLRSIWSGGRLESVRTAQERQSWDRLDLCRECGEWNRP